MLKVVCLPRIFCTLKQKGFDLAQRLQNGLGVPARAGDWGDNDNVFWIEMIEMVCWAQVSCETCL